MFSMSTFGRSGLDLRSGRVTPRRFLAAVRVCGLPRLERSWGGWTLVFYGEMALHGRLTRAFVSWLPDGALGQ